MPDNRTIIVKPLPFAAPCIINVPRGLSLADMVERALPAAAMHLALAEINGEPIERADFEAVRPADDDHVIIYTSVRDLGDNPLRAILSLVVVAVAAYSGNAAAVGLNLSEGSLGYAVVSAATTAVVASAGLALVNAITPLRGIHSNQQSYSDSKAYSIAGGSNVARPYGPIPVILGSHRVYPDLAAKPYTSVEGNDEYLYMLFCFGYGPLHIEDIRIGETPIENFEDVEFQLRQGFASDTRIYLIPSVVDQTRVGVDLLQSSGWVTRTVAAGASVIGVDVEFHRGLMRIDDAGSRRPVSVVVDIEYRKVGGEWINLAGARIYNQRNVDALGYNAPCNVKMSIYISADGAVYCEYGTREKDFNKRLCQYDIQTWTEAWQERWRAANLVNLSPSGVTGMTCSIDPGNDHNIIVAAGTATFDALMFTGATATVLRKNYTVGVDRNYAYEVRMRRLTADNTSDRVIDECRWSYIRTPTNEHPVNFHHPLALLAVKIRASGQLEGTIDKLSALCTSMADVWTGSAWSGPVPTNNQAALSRLVLMGPGNFRPRTADQMDDARFAAWYDLCESEGFQFNMVRDFTSSVWECFADICATGRAAPDINYGKWSVITDVDSKPVSQHITPRNSWGFSAKKTLIDLPHAFRVRFKNEEAGFDWDEVTVYSDGYTASNATMFETIELPGITNPDLAWRFGRFHLAQLILRPEEYFLSMDFEHLACARGNLVRCTHDVCLWGSGQARVKSLVTSGGDTTAVVVDDYLTMEAGKTYSARFRKDDGTSLLVAIDTVAGQHNELTLSVPIPTASGPAVGELMQFGETDRESAPLLVKRVERQTDFVARLTLVDAAPEIYDADTGEIPDFESYITAPIDITRVKPMTPVISEVMSDADALEYLGNTIRARMLVHLLSGAGETLPLMRYVVRWRMTGASAWDYATCMVDSPTVALVPVTELYIYELQAKAVSIYGISSDWCALTTHQVIGTFGNPSDIDSFAVDIVGTTAYLKWSAVTDLDLAGYKIRHSPATSGATWESASLLLEAIPSSAVSVSVAARQGTWLIKAFDRGGRESDNALSVINAYGDILDVNVVATITESPGFAGDKYSCHVDAGVLVLDYTDIEGVYSFQNVFDLGDVYTSRFTANVTAGGINVNDDIFLRVDFFGVEDFFGVQAGDWRIRPDFHMTDDDPTDPGAVWSDWIPLSVGDFTGRAFQFRINMESLDPDVTPAVTALSVTVDMPDRHIAGDDLVCPTTGLRVNFSPQFYGFSGVGFALQDMDTGDYYLVTNKDETGFDINFYDSTDTAVERTFDYVAKGYGRKAA